MDVKQLQENLLTFIDDSKRAAVALKALEDASYEGDDQIGLLKNYIKYLEYDKLNEILREVTKG
ncbi:hypothetical protein DDV21_010365 [Streptococcus chenjunshii]|uniref:Uncharacterized protein n=1 Tax=Streptococcus chenjunshii TaxID=2173853 RepID=A0A372KLN1_9STRE|nr:hypothetical protein [Streptococcus chenjunshii]AXQ79449.1 hypothetical protein DDV21_010365 [Streptococcus chenjunshii]RFU51093.1 hypothetical protein DDV22_05135 [Streptococcus chenjunshii]RFU53191.1 hypothetical protein DDV23_05645 [Streptococcus chenjunshii]